MAFDEKFAGMFSEIDISIVKIVEFNLLQIYCTTKMGATKKPAQVSQGGVLVENPARLTLIFSTNFVGHQFTYFVPRI